MLSYFYPVFYINVSMLLLYLKVSSLKSLLKEKRPTKFECFIQCTDSFFRTSISAKGVNMVVSNICVYGLLETKIHNSDWY